MDVDEVALDVAGVGVEARIFNAHLAHAPPGELLAVDLHGDGEMFFERGALLVNRRGGLRRARGGGEVGGGLEDPGVADGAGGDPDDVYAGLVEHADGVVGGEDVAGTEDRAVRILLLEFLENGPAAFAVVLLFDSAGVHADGGV